MRTGLFSFLLFVTVLACTNKNHVPSGILSKEKMRAVLWDMMRADQFLTDYVLRKDSSLDKVAESVKYYQRIFDLHHISETTFQESFSFYKNHPGLLKAIMDSLSRPALATTGEAPTQVVQPAAQDASGSPAGGSPAPPVRSQKDTAVKLDIRKGMSLQ